MGRDATEDAVKVNSAGFLFCYRSAGLNTSEASVHKLIHRAAPSSQWTPPEEVSPAVGSGTVGECIAETELGSALGDTLHARCSPPLRTHFRNIRQTTAGPKIKQWIA